MNRPTRALRWLAVALATALVLGAFLPDFGRMVFSMRYNVPSVMIAVGFGAFGLAMYFEGKQRSEDLGLFFAPVVAFGFASAAFGWSPVCYSFEEYNYAMERQANVLNVWNQCVFQGDEEACELARYDYEPLSEIDATVQGMLHNLCN